MSAQAQSFRRIEPGHPHAYQSTLATDPATLKPPQPTHSTPSASFTPPSYAHSPISGYRSSHASPITPEQADELWSNPSSMNYAQPSMNAADMLAARAGEYPPQQGLGAQYPQDFSRSRSASLTDQPGAPQPMYHEASYTQRSHLYSTHRNQAAATAEATGQWQQPLANMASVATGGRRPSAQYLSSHGHQNPPGIRVDQSEYRRARANSGDSLFITTMEELRINPTIPAVFGTETAADYQDPRQQQQQQQPGYLGGSNPTAYTDEDSDYYDQMGSQASSSRRRM